MCVCVLSKIKIPFARRIFYIEPTLQQPQIGPFRWVPVNRWAADPRLPPVEAILCLPHGLSLPLTRMHAQCICGTKSIMKVCCSCAARVLALRRHSVACVVREVCLDQSLVKRKKGPAHVRPPSSLSYSPPPLATCVHIEPSTYRAPYRFLLYAARRRLLIKANGLPSRASRDSVIIRSLVIVAPLFRARRARDLRVRVESYARSNFLSRRSCG